MTVDEFAATARDWLAEHRAVAPPDYGAICPPELIDAGIAWQRLLHEAGFAGIHWPVEHGGRGLTPEHQAAWLVESRARRGAAGAQHGRPGAGRRGTAAVRHARAAGPAPAGDARRGRRVVPAVLRAGRRQRPRSLTTRAERDGDRFVVNGQKVWCSGGRVSNWGILMARTDPGAAKHHGISFFLCPMDLPGIEVRPLRQMTGAAEFDEVFFTDVELPADRLLGPLHGGWGVGMSVLTNERGHIGTAVISLERRLEQFSRLGAERRLGPVERQQLAGLLATGTAYRSLAQRQRDQGGAIATTGGSLLKLGITEMMFEVATLRADTAGPAALLEGPDALGLLAAPGGRIAGGTSQVQRNIIGERLLGLPR